MKTKMTDPDFFIIGAMKCGTSTLAAQLSLQDGIFITDPKEPNFFSDDAVFAKGDQWYTGLFASANPDDIKGEASTHYTKLPTYPDTIKRLKGRGIHPKLIYLIRDPIDRLISHYIHEWTQGIISVPLEQALHNHPELRSYSCYGAQLTPWVGTFGSENILVFSINDLKQDPQGLLTQVGEFIGNGNVQWQEEAAQMNVSSERIRRLPLHGLLYNNRVATFLRKTLIPQSLRTKLKASRQMTSRPTLSDTKRQELIAEFSEDRAKFLALFPDRPQLKSTYPELF